MCVASGRHTLPPVIMLLAASCAFGLHPKPWTPNPKPDARLDFRLDVHFISFA